MKHLITLVMTSLLFAACGGGGGGSGDLSSAISMEEAGCPPGLSCKDACVEATAVANDSIKDIDDYCQLTCEDDQDPDAFRKDVCAVVNETRGTSGSGNLSEEEARENNSNPECSNPDYDCVQGCKDVNITCYSALDDDFLNNICNEQCQEQWFSDYTCSLIEGTTTLDDCTL